MRTHDIRRCGGHTISLKLTPCYFVVDLNLCDDRHKRGRHDELMFVYLSNNLSTISLETDEISWIIHRFKRNSKSPSRSTESISHIERCIFRERRILLTAGFDVQLVVLVADVLVRVGGRPEHQVQKYR